MFRTFHTSDKAGSNDNDKQDDDDEFISTHYHLDNDDDDEYDNDDDAENNESEQRDTFDLDCDDDSADEFFASDSFINAVELLGVKLNASTRNHSPTHRTEELRSVTRLTIHHLETWCFSDGSRRRCCSNQDLASSAQEVDGSQRKAEEEWA